MGFGGKAGESARAGPAHWGVARGIGAEFVDQRQGVHSADFAQGLQADHLGRPGHALRVAARLFEECREVAGDSGRAVGIGGERGAEALQVLGRDVVAACHRLKYAVGEAVGAEAVAQNDQGKVGKGAVGEGEGGEETPSGSGGGVSGTTSGGCGCRPVPGGRGQLLGWLGRRR